MNLMNFVGFHQIHQSLLELTYVYFLPQHIQIKYDNENPSIQSCASKVKNMIYINGNRRGHCFITSGITFKEFASNIPSLANSLNVIPDVIKQ
jgi:hypothetical protein